MSQLKNVLFASVLSSAVGGAFTAQPGVETSTAQFLGALEGSLSSSVGGKIELSLSPSTRHASRFSSA